MKFNIKFKNTSDNIWMNFWIFLSALKASRIPQTKSKNIFKQNSMNLKAHHHMFRIAEYVLECVNNVKQRLEGFMPCARAYNASKIFIVCLITLVKLFFCLNMWRIWTLKCILFNFISIVHYVLVEWEIRQPYESYEI